MPLVKMPTGETVNMPDQPTPQQVAELELLYGGSGQISAPGGGADSGQSSGTDIFLHRLGILGRAAATGLTSTVGLLGDALNTGINKVAGTNLAKPSQVLQTAMDQAGLPRPQTADEKFMSGLTTMGTGFFDPTMGALTNYIQGAKWLGGGAAPLYNAPATGSVRAQTLADAQDAGYKVPPSTAGTSRVGRAMEAISSPRNLQASMKQSNQNVTDSLMRRAAALPADSPLTEEALNAAIRDTYQKGYAPIRELGTIPATPTYNKALGDIMRQYQGVSGSFPQAARPEVGDLVSQYRVPSMNSSDTLDAISKLREAATDSFRTGNSNLGHAQRAVAGALEDNIGSYLQSLSDAGGNTLPGVMAGGKLQVAGSDLLDAYKAARTQLAKQYTVRDALVPGMGSGDALKLAAKLRNDAPLTGELKTIGQFANVAPQLAGVPKAPAQVFTPLEGAMMAGSGISGIMTANPHMVATAAVPLARLGARRLLQSGLGQQLFAQPALGAAAGGVPLGVQAFPGAYALGSGLFGQ